jgi:hypothetical protein
MSQEKKGDIYYGVLGVASNVLCNEKSYQEYCVFLILIEDRINGLHGSGNLVGDALPVNSQMALTTRI